MERTEVVNLKEEKYDVFIGRGSIWGNPFRITTKKNREDVIAEYEVYVRQNKSLMDQLHTLRGMKLGCFCAPMSCHGDVLVKLIEEQDEET